MNKDTYCYQGLLFFEDGEDVKIFDAESGEELVEHTLDEYHDEIELPSMWKTDSQYYVDDTSAFFTISYRSYRKTVAGPAYAAGCRYSSSNTSPIFVSDDPEFVKYTTSNGGGPFVYRSTCQYRGKTWYIAGGSYGFSSRTTSLPFDPNELSSDWSYLGLQFLQHIYES